MVDPLHMWAPQVIRMYLLLARGLQCCNHEIFFLSMHWALSLPSVRAPPLIKHPGRMAICGNPFRMPTGQSNHSFHIYFIYPSTILVLFCWLIQKVKIQKSIKKYYCLQDTKHK